MNWFARHVLLVHLAALVVVLSWVHGGARPDLLAPVVPWLTLMIIEWLLVFPQAKSTETLAESRRRVWLALARDPLLYVSLALTLLLAIPLFNVTFPPSFDAAAKQWIIPKPPVTWLPYSVNPDHHATLLLWFPPVLSAALAAKHGLLMKSKRALLEFVCWNGAALAVVGFAQLASGTQSLLWLTPLDSYFFSTFGYPNFAGAFFTLHAMIALGLWFQHATAESGLSLYVAESEEERSPISVHRLLIPAALCVVAAVSSLSRAAIMLSVLGVAVMIAYMLAYVWSRVTAGTRVTLVSIVGAIVISTAVALLVFKLDSLKGELRQITPAAVIERVTGSGYYHARIARLIFKDHPVFGVGGWGYGRYCRAHMEPEMQRAVQIQGGANVHNDSLQFLVEHGVVGYALIVSCALLLSLPLLIQAARLCRLKLPAEAKGGAGGATGWLTRIPPPLVGIWVGTGATVCHSLGDLPFRAPSVLVVWALALACVAGWMPVVTLERR
jgi:hypothetical protein